MGHISQKGAFSKLVNLMLTLVCLTNHKLTNLTGKSPKIPKLQNKKQILQLFIILRTFI